MFFKILLLGLLVGLLAYRADDTPLANVYVQGRNNTALFLTNREHGLSNAHVATASSLLEHWPEIQVHYGSFSSHSSKLERVSSLVRRRVPSASEIVFHQLPGLTLEEAVVGSGKNMDNLIRPPGVKGISGTLDDLQLYFAPWEADDYMAIYHRIQGLIDVVDPSVIVLDPLFLPAIEATRNKSRLHAIIAPNTIADHFLSHQPYWRMLWKYPALSSGFEYPVPLTKIPTNIYLNMRFIYAVLRGSQVGEKRNELRKRGMTNPLDVANVYRPDVPWISMDTEGASLPVEYVPPNVTAVGPMLLSPASAEEQDPEMTAWLKKAPTILVNFGSVFMYDNLHASIMATALADVLAKTSVQILWKIKPEEPANLNDDFLLPLSPYIQNGRIKVTNWLTTDPYALLETGHIAVSVHHGGSSCYHEAVASGTPQVILPMWLDLYNFANLASSKGFGVWACRNTTPRWTTPGISDAIIQALTDDEIRGNARTLGDRVRSGEKGRDAAAGVVARMARVG